MKSEQKKQELGEVLQEINDWVEDPILVLDILVKSYEELLNNVFHQIPLPMKDREPGKNELQLRYKSKTQKGIKPPKSVKEAHKKAVADLAVAKYALEYQKNKDD